MPHFLYILRSSKNGRFYIGSTTNIIRRFSEHVRGQTRSTKAGRPWMIQCLLEFRCRKEAGRAERFLKDLKSHDAVMDLIRNVM